MDMRRLSPAWLGAGVVCRRFLDYDGAMTDASKRPTQFTIRGIAFATFWVGACFAAFGLAKSGYVPSLYFTLAVLSLCCAVYALHKNATVAAGVRGKGNRRAFIAAIVVWNAPICPLMLAYGHGLGRVVGAIVSAWFGVIQPSHEWRIHAVLGNAFVTMPATLIALWVFDTISQRSWSWRRAALTIAVWESLLLVVLVGSSEIGFPYSLNQLGWALFGLPDDVYSFQNLVLHRIIAWLIETTFVAWTSLWFHSRPA